MKYRGLICFFFSICLLCRIAFGQDGSFSREFDKLKIMASEEKDPRRKAKILTYMAEEAIDRQSDTALFYAEAALTLARQTGYDSVAGVSMRIRGRC
ncbi:MAG: hypothetical protein R3B47_16125 [Bacteroidia bacterium]